MPPSSAQGSSVLRPFAAAAATVAMILVLAVPVPAAAAGDTDHDGLTNAFETTQSHTDPLKGDTNRDGVLDSAEDPDGDGLGSLGEQRFATDPLNRDTDGDGIADGREDSNGNGISNGTEQDRRPVPRRLTPSLAAAPADDPVSYAAGCHTTGLDAHIHPCVYGDPKGHTTIVLFGDSHAAQWLPGLIPPAKAGGWRIVTITKSACPSAAVRTTVSDVRAAAACKEWRRRAVAWIGTHLPDIVLLSNTRGYAVFDASGHRLRGARIEAAWTKGIEKTLGSLPGASKAVVIADTPRIHGDPPRCLAAHRDRISACVAPRSQAIDAGHVKAEKAAAAGAGAVFADLNAVVCPYDPCPVIVGHFLLWRNGSHLTATYARQLAPSVGDLVSRVLLAAPAATGMVRPATVRMD